MRRPRKLEPGGTIRLVTPSSPIAPERLDRGIAWLTELGYNVQVAPHALAEGSYLAGRDEDRLADLRDAFLDPGVDAVCCTRGGYGCARLVQSLDFAELAATDKLFIGFSDITTLHLGLNAHGLATAYAPMALTFHWAREAWVYESLASLLSGRDSIAKSAPAGSSVVGGRATGLVTGGCLCLLTDSIGTAYPLDARGRIVVIEDVDEPPHRVDAMLTHLLNAGTLQQAAGIVVGEMTGSDDKVDGTIGGVPWRDIVRERLTPLGIPTVIDFPFGHAKAMLSLPLGIEATLDADAGTLSYTEPLCR